MLGMVVCLLIATERMAVAGAGAGGQNCDGALLMARPLMTCERPVDGPGCLPQLWSSRASARPAWVVVGSLVVVVRGAGGCLQGPGAV